MQELHEQFFPSLDGVRRRDQRQPGGGQWPGLLLDQDETYCIGKKSSAATRVRFRPSPGNARAKARLPGSSWCPPTWRCTRAKADVQGHAFDANGRPLKTMVKGKWSLPIPRRRPNAKTPPPALKGEISRTAS